MINNFIKKISFDIYIFIPVIILALIGVLSVYSSTGSVEMANSQLKRVLFGFLVMMLVSQLNPDFIQSFVSKYGYILNVFLLFLVLIVGTKAMGATRWLNLGLISFQPSELVKITLPMFMAYLIFKKDKPSTIRDFIKYGLIIIIPTILTVVQPDLGTSIIIIMSGVIVLFQAGISFTFIFLVLSLISIMIPVFWTFLMDYQKQRVLTMFNPEMDSLGSGYHIIQSKIAIGNGGFFGSGFLSGTQTQLGFIPEQHTDFIFSAFAEEYGFIGFLFILFLYLVIIVRVFYIINKLSNIYQKLVSGSIIFVFSLYIFINLGMISGILPVVGVPLPFFSYGGTSMIIQMLSFGIICSFYSHMYISKKNIYNLKI